MGPQEPEPLLFRKSIDVREEAPQGWMACKRSEGIALEFFILVFLRWR